MTVHLLQALAPLIEGMAAHAAALDQDELFPVADIEGLKRVGAFTAPLPVAYGGLGAGTEPSGASLLADVLQRVGRGNLNVGRILEAHVNAVRLIMEFGSRDQQGEVAREVISGHVFGVWVTDPPGAPLTLKAGMLQGSKGPCSGAGHVTRALVTVGLPGGTHMAVVRLDGSEQVAPMKGVLHGMRSCANGVVRFDGIPLPETTLIGGAGDYLREPSLSTGAWRTSAVTLGGLDALVEAARTHLNRRNHVGDLQQQDRFGRIMIAHETASLWTAKAARIGEDHSVTALDRVAYVNLARIAIEAAALDVMQLVQRSVGMSAFIRPSPIERLLRDLAIYLRQPAPDAVLAEAALHGLRQA